MSNTCLENVLKRYTDILTLAYLLTAKKITLLDPQSWDDTNDSSYLAMYKEKKCLTTVLALCFTQAKETYHHWKVFAGSSHGICIEFDRASILEKFTKHEGVKCRAVEYLTLKKIKAIRKKRSLTLDRLPFVKEVGFKDEKEFRVIYESTSQHQSHLDIPVPLSCIRRVTFSPWADERLISAVKHLFRSLDGCGKLKLCRSTLISNDTWKSIGESVAKTW